MARGAPGAQQGKDLKLPVSPARGSALTQLLQALLLLLPPLADALGLLGQPVSLGYGRVGVRGAVGLLQEVSSPPSAADSPPGSTGPGSSLLVFSPGAAQGTALCSVPLLKPPAGWDTQPDAAQPRD